MTTDHECSPCPCGVGDDHCRDNCPTPKPVSVDALIRHAGEATLQRMVEEASAYEHLRRWLLGEFPVGTQRDYALQPGSHEPEVRGPVIEETRIPIGDEADLIVSSVGGQDGKVSVVLKVEGRGVSLLAIEVQGGGIPGGVKVDGGEVSPFGSKAEGGEVPNDVGEAHRPTTPDLRDGGSTARGLDLEARCFECGAYASIRSTGGLMTHPYGHEDSDPCPSNRYVEGTERQAED